MPSGISLLAAFAILVLPDEHYCIEGKLKEKARRDPWTICCAKFHRGSNLPSLPSCVCERLQPSSLITRWRLGRSEIFLIFCPGFPPAWWVTLCKAPPPPLPFCKIELIMLKSVFLWNMHWGLQIEPDIYCHLCVAWLFALCMLPTRVFQWSHRWQQICHSSVSVPCAGKTE